MHITYKSGSGIGTAVNVNVNKCNYPTVNAFSKNCFLSQPAFTDSRYYGHQIAVPKVSKITGIYSSVQFM